MLRDMMTGGRSGITRPSGRPLSICALILCAGLLACVVIGCRDKVDESRALLEERSRRGFIAFVGAGPSDPLWPVIQAGAHNYDSGSPIEIRRFNPPQDTPQSQIDLLAQLEDPDLRGICVHMSDMDTVSPVLGRLKKHGVMVVTMGAPAPSSLRIPHVGTNDTEIGEALARCTVDALGEKGGTIMILHAGDDHPVYGPRHLAFTEQLRRKSRIIVMGDLNCKGDPATARQIIKERSARYPRLDLWVAMDDWPLADGVPAGEVFGQGGQRYITFGGFPRHWSLVRDGVCPFIVAAEYGQIAVRAATICNSGIREPLQDQRDYRVPLRIIDAANLMAYSQDWATWSSAPDAVSTPSRPHAAY